MTARNKNIPALRFKEFTTPLDVTKFGKVVESNLYGPRFNADDYSDEGNVKTIRGTDLGRDGEIKYDQVPLARLDENNVANHKLIEGDIVMITTADCGSTGVFRKQEVDFLSSAYGVRIRLNKLGYPYYFKYFFQTRLAKKEINSFIRKATVANLPGSDILKIKLFLPELPEQQKIASFLSAIDEKIRQLTRRKELLEQYKKGVMQQLFSGKLRFKDEKGKAYPKWEEKRLGEVCQFFSGGTPKSTNKTFYAGNIPFIGSGNIYDSEVSNFISEEALNSSSAKLVKKGDLLFALYGANSGEVAISKINGAINQAVLCIRSTENIKYIYHVLLFSKDSIVSKYLQGGQGNLSAKIVKQLKFKFPSLREQEKIVSFLSSIDSKIESVNAQIEGTKGHKKGLLQQMFV